MKTTIRTLNAIVAAFALSILSTAAGGLECAIDEALRAKADFSSETLPASTITLSEHRFNLYAVRVTEEAKRSRTLEGQIVRITGEAKEDTILYRIAKNRGAVARIELRVNDNDWLQLSQPMTAAFGKLAEGGPMTQDDRNAIFAKLQKTAGSDWQRLAELIVTHLAVREC